jgi:hypothetical protein
MVKQQKIPQVHRKNLASVGAANQVSVVATKSTGTASTESATAKFAIPI